MKTPRATHRLLVVIVVAVAVVSGGRAGATAPPVWSHPTRGGPWGLAADRAGLVVITDAPDVEALDRKGHVRWESRVDSLVEATPAAGGGRVLVGGRGLVTALARSNGATVWRQTMDGDVTALALAGDVALAGGDAGTFTAFDARTGEPRWSVHFDGRLWTAPQVDRRTGSVMATWHDSATPSVRVFDLATGALRWEAAVGAYTAAPVIRGDAVVIASGDGNGHAQVEAHDLATGALRWRTAAPGSFEAAIEPAADNRDVVVVDHLGVVTLLDLKTGALRWRHDSEFALVDTRMLLTARRVAFRSFSGDVFVLARTDGHLVSRLSAHQLGGYPIAVLHPPWPGPGRFLVALRYDSTRVDLRPFP